MAPRRTDKEAMEAADVVTLIEERTIPGRDLILRNFSLSLFLVSSAGSPSSLMGLLHSSELREFISFGEMDSLG